MIIVCSDPGHTNPEEPLIEMDDLTGTIPPVKNFNTIYKVNHIFEKIIKNYYTE